MTTMPSTASTDHAEPRPALLRLRLYVAGDLPNSARAQENLRRVCDEQFAGRYELEVIDFLQAPQRALQDGVLVTPTLVKLEPAPRRVIVGTLSDRDVLLAALAAEERHDG